MANLQSVFDRVVVLNLARRADRMSQFSRAIASGWPFLPPQRVEAVDGATVTLPAEWTHGPGAWGCMLSHRQIIRSAIADNVESILVLEDDAAPVDGFVDSVGEFFEHLPADWDCLMLGGQHLRRPTFIAPGVVQCQITNRMHAYAIRRRMMPGLLKFWEVTPNDHCDVVLAACMNFFKAYAPDPFLIGQASSFSDITLQFEPERLTFAPPMRQRIAPASPSAPRGQSGTNAA